MNITEGEGVDNWLEELDMFAQGDEDLASAAAAAASSSSSSCPSSTAYATDYTPLVIPDDIKTQVRRECSILEQYLTDYIQHHDVQRCAESRALMQSLPALAGPSVDVFAGEKLEVKNHMLFFKLGCTGWNGDTPLHDLMRFFPGSRIPQRFLALIYTPPPPLSCSILLFKSWSVISTGGTSLADSIRCIQHFLEILYKAMRDEINKAAQVRCFVMFASLKNRMSPNRIPNKFIDIISLYDKARASGIKASCIPSQINNVTLRPFPDQFNSLVIMFFPRGGVNIMGVVYDDELLLCEEFIRRFLPPFLRVIPPALVHIAEKESAEEQARAEREFSNARSGAGA